VEQNERETSEPRLLKPLSQTRLHQIHRHGRSLREQSRSAGKQAPRRSTQAILLSFIVAHDPNRNECLRTEEQTSVAKACCSAYGRYKNGRNDAELRKSVKTMMSRSSAFIYRFMHLLLKA
jgi:hypothetical protein